MGEKKGLIIGIVATILVFVVIAAIVIISNTNNTNSNSQKEENTRSTPNNESQVQTSSNGTIVRESSSEAIYNKYQVHLKKVAVEFVGNTLNLQVVFANDTNEDKEFDCSKFSIKTTGGDTLKVNATGTKTIKSNSNYVQYAFTIEDEGKVEVGNIVYAYYDLDSLGPVEVTKF